MVSAPTKERIRTGNGGRSDRLATGLDAVVLVTSAWMLAVSVGIDPLPGRRWAALVFLLLAPGWAAQRRLRATADAESVFVAVGTSIAIALVAGHLAVTVFGWHWAPVLFVLAAATGGSMGEQWLRWGPSGVRHAPSVESPIGSPVGDGVDAAGGPWLDDRRWWTALGLGAVGGLVALVGLVGADQEDVGSLGLLPAIPVIAGIGAAMTVAAVVALLGERPRDHLASGGLLALLIVVLHGAPGIIEENPRFAVAWLHVGFVDHISTEGTLLTDLDARFSWPGFFAGGALLDRAAGTDGVLWMLRFAPVVFTGLACLGIWVLARSLRMSSTTAGGACLLFVVVNWSAQDYFSPQATAFLLTLLVFVLVSRWFPGRGPDPSGVVGRMLRWRGDADDVPTVDADEPSRELGRLVVVLGVCGAVIISHQLTPGFLTAALLALGLAGVIRLRWIGAMVLLMTAAWLSFAGEAWWLGHLDTLTGSVGDVGGIVEDNVGQRTAGADASRETVLRARLGLSLLLWGGAALVLARAWWAGPSRRDVFLAALFLSPFPLLVAQPYGGELVIRIFLFVLPAAALVLAGAVLGDAAPWRRVILGVALIAALPLFALARFGNEAFEMVRDGDLETVQVLLDEAPDGTVVFVANGQALMNVDRVGDFRYVDLGDLAADAVVARLDGVDGAEARFVFLSRPQQVFGELSQSRTPGWLESAADELVATGDFVVHQNDARGAVLEYRP